jgi:hypothetical protein
MQWEECSTNGTIRYDSEKMILKYEDGCKHGCMEFTILSEHHVNVWTELNWLKRRLRGGFCVEYSCSSNAKNYFGI